MSQDEVSYWMQRSRQNEGRAKRAEAALRDLQATTAHQIEAAREQGRAEALASTRDLVVAAELRGALTGVVPDPAAIVEDLDLAKFVNDDGQPDTTKIAAKVEHLRAAALTARPAKRRFTTGATR